MTDKTKLEALARMVAAEIEGAPKRPRLRLVSRADLAEQVAPGIDPITRASMVSRIRDLSRMYYLQWLIRQEAPDVGNMIEALEDDRLVALLEKMERGRECRVEGIGFDDAGLVRSQEIA